MIARFSCAVAFLAAAAPAWADPGAQVPEGSQLTLFALGILGVVIGRRFSMGRKP